MISQAIVEAPNALRHHNRTMQDEMGRLVGVVFDGHRIRVTNQDGQPGFVAVDVRKAVGLTQTAVSKWKSGMSRSDVTAYVLEIRMFHGGMHRRMDVLTEAGLYALMLQSNKPAALAFKRWVLEEALPSIRKGVPPIPPPAPVAEQAIIVDALHQLLKAYVVRVSEENARLSKLLRVPHLAPALPHKVDLKLLPRRTYSITELVNHTRLSRGKVERTLERAGYVDCNKQPTKKAAGYYTREDRKWSKEGPNGGVSEGVHRNLVVWYEDILDACAWS